jgi:hypothetical protein
MSEYPKNPGPLPAEKLCNKYNNPNPIKGEGALGNETKGKMYYEGKGDKKSLVETLQTMLRDLKKYDLGSFGPNNDGVDGTFGNSTEDAVKQFQEEHKDWDSNALKVDGLVGPDTADALNREMVGKWYDHYQTPVELVEGVPYHAITSEFISKGLSVETGGAKRSKVFLVGLIPSIEVTCSVRVLGFDLEPVKGTSCEIRAGESVQRTTTDDDGIATFNVSDQVKHCHVKWELPSGNGEGKLSVEREVLFPPRETKDTNQRLSNLGHLQAELSDQIRSYQQEMGREETGMESDVAAEVRAWHDGGPKPQKGGAITNGGNSRLFLEGSREDDVGPSNQGKKAPTATTAPAIRVELYQENRVWAPAEVCRDTRTSLWKLDILRGSHTAVRFINAPGLDIRSNNPFNAVPNDSAVWVDQNASSSPRTIFFYGRFMPIDPAARSQDQCTLFEVWQNGNPGRALLQVWVRDYPNSIVFIKLMGNSFVLNSAATDLRPYNNFPNRSATIANSMSQQDIINLVINRGHLDHLVINAHGRADQNGITKNFEIDLGLRFSQANLHYWNQLDGRVEYIWLLNCIVGSDDHLCAEIASRTQAWVIAPFWSTEIQPRNMPQYHIDYQVQSGFKFWNGKELRRLRIPKPRKKDEPLDPKMDKAQGGELFFYNARRSINSPDLSSSLYFNIVKKGPSSRRP